MHIWNLIIKPRMAQIGAVNIANGSGIIHCQRRAERMGGTDGRRDGGGEGRWGVKFDYSAHTMARCLMIPLHLGKRHRADLRRRVTQVWPSVRREIIRPPPALPYAILISNTLIFPAQIFSMNIPGCSLFVGR